MTEEKTKKIEEAEKPEVKETISESPQQKEEVKTEEKVEEKKTEKVKKDKAIVNAKNINMSLKHAIAICKMIKKKNIAESISLLEQVTMIKKAVPMRGELPHRKGMMSGRYPQKAAKTIIKLLKSLTSNCIANGLDLDKTIIAEAIPNTAGKATNSKKGKKIHLTLKAIEKSEGDKKK